MTNDGKEVFRCIGNCEVSTYMTPYSPERCVVSVPNMASLLKWTKYRVRKAVKALVAMGLIERASCGNPAVESFGEYHELIYESAPPTNGFAITKEGFKCEEWQKLYADWNRSLEEWADKED
jgi:predicted transcriptional regulator